MLKGFKEFLLRGNVIDLAVAVVIGAAFGAVVTALVEDLLTPLIAAIGGQPDFSALSFTINGSNFLYGAFFNAVINFVFVAAAIYFFVVMPVKRVTEMRAARIAAGQPADEAVVPSDELVTLREIRDLLLAQQGPPSKSV
jgi:large conductance mechanosensitive channel